MENLKLPDAPLITAGALGGPFVIYLSTPLRNALTYGAKDTSLSLLECYKQPFKRGFLRGWTGGHYFAVAACPQFLMLGPMYHMYASVAGAVGGMFLAGLTESLIIFGAETKNAQLAHNQKAKGASVIPANRLQSPLKPIGPGFVVNVSRNFFAMFGLRLLCQPITSGLEKITGKKNAAITLAGDFTANCCASAITAPMHQTYLYRVTSPEVWDKPRLEQVQGIKNFLKETYTTKNTSGGRSISPIVFRDIGLRCGYIAVIYTMFANIERACVKFWPK